MAGEYVFNLQRVTKIYNKTPVLEDVTLAFFYGAKIGVIGGNGAGKSSLLRIMAGVDRDFMGEALLERKLNIGYLPQEPQLTPGCTVAQAVDEGVATARAMLERYDRICEELGGDLTPEASERLSTEMGDLQEKIDTLNLWELDHQLEVAMDALRLPPGDTPSDILSGGEKRRVALCRLLVANPDVLLLDEPTNHLDAESVAWLETYLRQFKGTVVVITHDRYFLNDVTEWILELDGGRAYPFKGNYTAWLEQKQQLLQREQKQMQSRRKLLEQELAWVRMNPAGRRSRNKARLNRYEELVRQTVDTQTDNLEIQIPPGARLGDLVVRAENLTKVFDDRMLMHNVNFDLPRGGIVGVIGANGAGKTTLFKMIIGQENPSAGKLTVGSSVQVAHVDQTRDALDPEKTVFEEITGGRDTVELGGHSMNSRAYCSRFNLRGADQQKKVGQMSGGERNRIHLAKLLKSGGNLLLLDEPTNDLDVTTLRALEEAIINFGGCAVVISHDRWFLDRVATHIMAFEGDSQVTWFEGNYEAYHEQRRRLLGEEADRPHRIKFRPIAT